MRTQGLSVQKIAATEKVTHALVCEVLGIAVGEESIAYSNIHIGCDLDHTGMFHEISTMKWV